MIRRTFLKALACLPFLGVQPDNGWRHSSTCFDGRRNSMYLDGAAINDNHPLHKGLVGWWSGSVDLKPVKWTRIV